jgi:hypothetical protein
MPKARLISAGKVPPVFSDRGSLRWAAGSGNLGAAPEAILADVMPDPVRDPAPDAVPDDNWAETIRRREAAEGMTAIPELALPLRPPGAAYVPAAPSDLTPLPDRFTLDIERKPDGWWIVRAPTVHIGLFIAHQDLATALADAPGALAAIVRLDGQVPKPQTRRKKP